MDYASLYRVLSLDEQEAIEQRSTEIQKEITSENAIEIPALLEGTQGRLRLGWLCELLSLELDRRQSQGQDVAHEDLLLADYPEIRREIQTALDHFHWVSAPFPMSVGSFSLLECHGVRRHARLFQARSKAGQSEVALILSACKGTEPFAWRSFLREEAKALEQAAGPSVAKHLHHGEADGRFYLVTEWLPHSITQKSEYASQLGVYALANDFADLAVSLQHAHHLGIFHHDLNPSNIRLNASTQPKITGFGLGMSAMATRRTIYPEDKLASAAAFWAPEVFRDNFLNPGAIDTFGLGATLYQLCTGHTPYEGPDALERAEKGEWNRTALEQCRVAAGIKRICERSLAPSTRDRIASVHDFGMRLRAFANRPAILRRTFFVSSIATGALAATALAGWAGLTLLPPKNTPIVLRPSWIEVQATKHGIDPARVKAANIRVQLEKFDQNGMPPSLNHDDAVAVLIIQLESPAQEFGEALEVRWGDHAWEEPKFNSADWKWREYIDIRDFISNRPLEVRFFSRATSTSKEFELGPFQFNINLSDYNDQCITPLLNSVLDAGWVTSDKGLRWSITELYTHQYSVVHEIRLGIAPSDLNHTVKLREQADGPPADPNLVRKHFDEHIIELNNPPVLYTQLVMANGIVSRVKKQEADQSAWNEIVSAENFIVHSKSWRLAEGLREVVLQGALIEILLGTSESDLSVAVRFDPKIRGERAYAEWTRGNAELAKATDALKEHPALYAQLRFLGGRTTTVQPMKR